MSEVLNISEESRKKYMEKISRLCLMDDDFMSICFNGDNECTEFVLKIILDTDDLTVTDVKTQYSVKNIKGRSVRLDVFATDSTGKKYNIEIQRADNGAISQRARYNSSLIDSELLDSGEAYDDLPQTYVIFITEHDVLKCGKPIYHIERMILETGKPFGDGSHIIYVNASHKDDTALGKLMHDLCCPDPKEMNYPLLSKKTNYFKSETEGETDMCKIFEEIRNEGIEEGRKKEKELAKELAKESAIEAAKKKTEELAVSMLKDGLSFEKISRYTELSFERISELAASLNAE